MGGQITVLLLFHRTLSVHVTDSHMNNKKNKNVLIDLFQFQDTLGKKRDAYLAPETRQLKYIIYIANSAVHDLPVTDVVEYENSTLQGWIFMRQINRLSPVKNQPAKPQSR